jgi:hypothetical protein
LSRVHNVGLAAMIYRFKSKASSELLMMGPQGDRLLALLGREPSARGIIEPAQIPAALAALRAAIAASEAGAAPGATENAGNADKAAVAEEADAHHEGERAISLRARLWPMITMLERAAAEEVPVVWGV